jgi:tRNA(Ile)-lysidine synthase
VFDAFVRRLDPSSPAPIGVALSGGGDSLALLHLTLDRARGWGRPVLALVVDHGLHPDSGAWTRFACAAAERAGATPVPLLWEGEKPATGLPAAARRARHALIAEAARALGCRVVLFGHTADDAAEAAAMRAAGSSVGTPVEWAPSPVWPEGRDVFVLRPLLGASRAGLRALLTERGETWLEDPANADPRFARSRARVIASSGRIPGVPRVPENAETRTLARHTRRALASDQLEGSHGPGLDPRLRGGERGEGWLEFDLDLDLPTLARALLCASGGDRPPKADAVGRMLTRFRSGELRTATLAGARAVVDGDGLLMVVREPGRAGLGDLRLDPDRASVWDGRYAVAGDRPGTVRAVAGHASRLAPADRVRLRAVPAVARATLPLFLPDDGSGPVLATNLPQTRCLVAERFRAACGLIAHERDIVVSRRGAVDARPLC